MAQEGIEIRGAMTPEFAEILTPEALAFIAGLQRAFNGRRLALLQRRAERQKEIDAGQMPDFLPETAEIRAAEWTVASIPDDLQDRRVEITGPVDRKMVINALNSGASVFMADFEDAHSPTWAATIEGQINLRDATTRPITFTSPEGQGLPPERADGRAAGPPARLAPHREARPRRRRADVGPRCSTSASTSSTTPATCWPATPAPISICPSWRAIWRPACGTTSSSWPRSGSACPTARSAPRC